jgi:hypothetical protein
LKSWLGIAETKGDKIEEPPTVDDNKGKGRDKGDAGGKGYGTECKKELQ